MKPRPIVPIASENEAGTPSAWVRFVTVGMIVAVVSLAAFYGRKADRTIETPVIERVVYYLVYVLGFVGLWIQRKAATQYIKAAWPIVAYCALACISTIWSYDPRETLFQSVGLATMVMLALFLSRTYGLKAFINTIAFTITILALISIAVVVALPEIGTMSDGTGWSGVFGAKNPCGWAMVLGLVALTCSLDTTAGAARWRRIAGIAICLILLAGSRSGTSVFVVAFVAVAFPILLWSRARQSKRSAVVVFSVIGALIIAMASIDVDSLLSVFGKDSTLTGRTLLWSVLRDAVAQRPLTGYGFGVFWDPDGPADNIVVPKVDWSPGEAHDGYLDIALDLGLAGETLFIAFLLFGLKRALAVFWRGRDLASAWPLFTMLSLTLANLAESNFGKIENLHWLIFLTAFFFSVNGFERLPKLSLSKYRPFNPRPKAEALTA